MAQFDVFEPEETAIEAIRADDRLAFADFVRRHNGWVRGVIYGVLGARDEIDDVAQQVWTTVWQRIGELRDAGRWRPWLYRLAHNAAIDAGRARQRHTRRLRRLPASDRVATDSSSPTVAPVSNRRPTPDRELVGREVYEEVLAAIQALPVLYREPFVLRHLNGWSYGKIADVMGMPIDTVETRLVRARRFLRESLKDKVL